jgi:hypothetical protein
MSTTPPSVWSAILRSEFLVSEPLVK